MKLKISSFLTLIFILFTNHQLQLYRQLSDFSTSTKTAGTSLRLPPNGACRLTFTQIIILPSHFVNISSFQRFQIFLTFRYNVPKSFPELNKRRSSLCRTIIARDKSHSKQHSDNPQLQTIIGCYGPRDHNNILRRFSGATVSDSWLRLKWADFPLCIRCSTPNSAAQFERPQSTTQPF